MKVLFDGVKEFSTKDFENNKDLFDKLKDSQFPHTLFIGCSDSRVVPVMITKSNPGDLFVIRNVANIVPYFRLSSEYLATTSAIEYAVVMLNVQTIIICGHTNCGGCRALFMKDEELEQIPNTKKWLELAQTARVRAEEIKSEIGNEEDIYSIVEKANIVEQLNHLMTYPFIKKKQASGELTILGWYYDIGTGKVYNYNFIDKTFDLIE